MRNNKCNMDDTALNMEESRIDKVTDYKPGV
jgi:hypothetical protein